MGICDVFRDTEFVFHFTNSASYKVKKKWRDSVTDRGGVVSYIITKKTYCFVLQDKDQLKDLTSFKLKKCEESGVFIVSTDYITACTNEGKMLKPQDFTLVKNIHTKPLTLKNLEVAKKSKSSLRKSSKTTAKSVVQKTADFEDGLTVKKALFQKGDEFAVIELQMSLSEELNVAVHKGKAANKSFTVKHWPVKSTAESYDTFMQQCQFFVNGKFERRQFEDVKPIEGSCSQVLLQDWRTLYEEAHIELPAEVQCLVSNVWSECLGEIKDALSGPVSSISPEQITQCEGLLHEMRVILKKSTTVSKQTQQNQGYKPKSNESVKQPLSNVDKEKLEDLSNEFYTCLPHKPDRKESITTVSQVAEKENLCQLLHDVSSVLESTHWRDDISVMSKYRALRCHMELLQTDSLDYGDIHRSVTNQPPGSKAIKVKNIFRVQRKLEDENFQRDLGHSKMLFHSSAFSNFMSILSRGLLMPHSVEQDIGGSRTDEGMLGHALYFSDASTTSTRYSTPGLKSSGTRLMLVNEVALGNTFRTTRHDTHLTAPPEGYHSIHGVPSQEDLSDFQVSEYAVYRASQQRMRYLVEFSLDGDVCKETPLVQGAADEPLQLVEKLDVDLDSVKNMKVSDTQFGLQSNTDKKVPLHSVHIRAKLKDLAAKVVVLQEYHNSSASSIEAKYVFPLEESAVVCGFEAFINGKHIVGEVKEKEKARKEYREAIAQGHGAYLMEEEKPEVFTVSVGNLPPSARVLIKITYVAELLFEGESIVFKLPNTVAPWDKEVALAKSTQSDLATVKVKEKVDKFSLQVSIEMPFDIRTIECTTHPIKMKKTSTIGFVELPGSCSLSEEFVLQVCLSHIHVPRMWVERHPLKHSQACMVTLYPELFLQNSKNTEVILAVDCSNSMRATEKFKAALQVTLLLLNELPEDCRFNVVAFGSTFVEAFPVPLVYKKDSDKVAEATDFVKHLTACRGNTDLWKVLEGVAKLPPGGDDCVRSVVLVSDGHISNQEATLRLLRQNNRRARLFTCGVGSDAANHTLKRLAVVGCGFYEKFDNSLKSKWEDKVKCQLTKCAQPAISDVHLEWQNFNANLDIQAPRIISSVFSGSRMVVYGYVENSTQATLHAVRDGVELTSTVSTPEVCISTDKILHTLTARAVIRDWENGLLDTDAVKQEVDRKNNKQRIVSLSKEYCIVTQFTSFVAIEDRSKDDTVPAEGPNVKELLSGESVDCLPYIGWEVDVEEPKETEDESSELPQMLDKTNIDSYKEYFKCILKETEDESSELLQKLALTQTYSMHEAKTCADRLMELVPSLDNKTFPDLRTKIYEALSDFYGTTEKADTIKKLFPEKQKPTSGMLFVKTLTGKTIGFDTHFGKTSVMELKKRIYDKEGIPPDSQRIIYAGIQLRDDEMLDYYNIEKDAVVHLVLHLRGGPGGPPEQLTKEEIREKVKKLRAASEAKKKTREEAGTSKPLYLSMKAKQIKKGPESAQKPDIAQKMGPESAQKPDIAQKMGPESAQKPDIAQKMGPESAQKPDIAQKMGPESAQKPDIAQKMGPESAQKPDIAQKKGPESAQIPDIAQKMIREQSCLEMSLKAESAVNTDWMKVEGRAVKKPPATNVPEVLKQQSVDRLDASSSSEDDSFGEEEEDYFVPRERIKTQKAAPVPRMPSKKTPVTFKSMKALKSPIDEIKKTSKEPANLMYEQGELLDNIEIQMETQEMLVKEANQQLAKAIPYKKRVPLNKQEDPSFDPRSRSLKDKVHMEEIPVSGEKITGDISDGQSSRRLSISEHAIQTQSKKSGGTPSEENQQLEDLYHDEYVPSIKAQIPATRLYSQQHDSAKEKTIQTGEARRGGFRMESDAMPATDSDFQEKPKEATATANQATTINFGKNPRTVIAGILQKSRSRDREDEYARTDLSSKPRFALLSGSGSESSPPPPMRKRAEEKPSQKIPSQATRAQDQKITGSPGDKADSPGDRKLTQTQKKPIVKGKPPGPVQITAEAIIREAKATRLSQLQEIMGPLARQKSALQMKAVQAQVDEVVDIMRVNVDKVLERDQKLADLDTKAEVLESQAKAFSANSVVQAQVDEVVDIMRVNVDNALERDQKLADLDTKAEVLESQAKAFSAKSVELEKGNTGTSAEAKASDRLQALEPKKQRLQGLRVKTRKREQRSVLSHKLEDFSDKMSGERFLETEETVTQTEGEKRGFRCGVKLKSRSDEISNQEPKQPSDHTQGGLTTDAPPVGLDVSVGKSGFWQGVVSDINFPMSLSRMKKIFEMQEEDGFWGFTEKTCIVCGLKKSEIFSKLRELGLYSLGSRTADDVERMVVTLLVLLILFRQCLDKAESLRQTEILTAECRRQEDSTTLFVTWRLLPDADDITTRYQEKPEEITTTVPNFIGLFQSLTNKAVNWLLEKDFQYPLLYSTLELGNSKEQFAEDLFTVVKNSAYTI